MPEIMKAERYRENWPGGGARKVEGDFYKSCGTRPKLTLTDTLTCA